MLSGAPVSHLLPAGTRHVDTSATHGAALVQALHHLRAA